jgi:hypothetical protein
MGADQSLYAYVGERILDGGLPYRDAWDQKPPAVHFLYAGMRAIWPGDGVVAAADLVAAAAVGWLLYRLGGAIGPSGAGAAAALIFLLLSNPSLTRLSGIRLRSQCETFIAVLVAGAFFLLARRRRDGPSPLPIVGAGLLLGLAFTFKYNAAVFALAGVAVMWLAHRPSIGDLARLIAGFAIAPCVLLLVFALGGTLQPLYDATILYNLQYSGETYDGALGPARYLLAFPVERARVDALWTLGGAGCLILLPAALGARAHLIPVVWVAAACASIAINGSRGLPQYFVQANPGLALAAGWAGVLAWHSMRQSLGRSAWKIAVPVGLIVLVAAWRVGDRPFPKLVEQTLFDARHAFGGIDRQTYLARYDDDRKYSALAGTTLGAYLRSHSADSDRVFVFGFTCAAYVEADRASASRFFWSRPVIVGFNADRPGYGAEGLLAELQTNQPAVIALQKQDWAPDTDDSAAFFLATPALADWLRASYVQADGPEGFDVWLRRSGQP